MSFGKAVANVFTHLPRRPSTFSGKLETCCHRKISVPRVGRRGIGYRDSHRACHPSLRQEEEFAMLFRNWWKRMMIKRASELHKRPLRRRRGLVLERLEDRSVPSAPGSF